jgi:serine/threonine protein phosphatase PrpC
MSKAFNSTKTCGSSTCVVCVLNRKNLIAANLGDSGFFIVRHSQQQISNDSIPPFHMGNGN